MATAVTYARLSEVEKGDTDGIQRQQRELDAFAERLGLEVVERLTDNDISAAKKVKRPAFDRLMAGIAANEWDVVIFRSLDRWVRRPAELEVVIEIVEKSNVRVELIHGGAANLRSIDGRANARVVTAFSMAEVERTRQRVTDWHADRAARGIQSGRPGFGYRKVDGKTVIDEREAARIRDAAQRVLAGEALNSIAKTPIGDDERPWTGKLIKRTLISPRVAGIREHRGEHAGPADWEPILDRHTWERVVRILTRPERRSSKSNDVKLLTGLLHCGKCPRTLSSAPFKGIPRYACKHCWGVTIRGAFVERHVQLRLFAIVDEEPIDLRPDVDVDALADEILRVDAELRDAVAAVGDGVLTLIEFKEIKNRIEARRDKLRARLGQPLRNEWRGRGAELAQRWEDMGIAEQRAVIDAWIADITIGPGKPHVFDGDRVRIIPR